MLSHNISTNKGSLCELPRFSLFNYFTSRQQLRLCPTFSRSWLLIPYSTFRITLWLQCPSITGWSESNTFWSYSWNNGSSFVSWRTHFQSTYVACARWRSWATSRGFYLYLRSSWRGEPSCQIRCTSAARDNTYFSTSAPEGSSYSVFLTPTIVIIFHFATSLSFILVPLEGNRPYPLDLLFYLC